MALDNSAGIHHQLTSIGLGQKQETAAAERPSKPQKQKQIGGDS